MFLISGSVISRRQAVQLFDNAVYFLVDLLQNCLQAEFQIDKLLMCIGFFY